MQPTLCSRCKKNIAMIFITKIENGQTVNEGICLKCANELGIKPVNDMMQRMGITENDIDNISTELMEVMQDTDAVPEEGEEDEGRTATFPFLNRLFGASPENGPEQERPPRREKEKKDDKKTKRKFLENYCTSLSTRAGEGKLDRVIGRATEIERVIQILNRRQKNNPCLIGEPGVGKTAIAEGLAQRIADGDVPEKLKTKEVYLLDLTALVAGTQFRGQFESRMKGLIEEIKKLGNIILVIDEVHNIVGAGDAEGSMNAANILKPALSRGEIQVIGTTTFAEYRKHIEKDSALERRFQPIVVNEPSVDETVEILKGIAHYYERFHGVQISDAVARQAVLLSERYITDRFLPDKAIDLIDEACSDMNLRDRRIGQTEKMRGELREIEDEREGMIGDSSPEAYQRLAYLRSREIQLSARIGEAEHNAPELTVENLARVIELWTKIPAANIKEAEFERLKHLETRMKKRIIGQDEAVAAVAAAIRRGRVGISAKRKPVSFIFVGPTGVGKTEFVKCLSADLFDSPESMIRLDMSEFMEKHSVSRIIGAPPGYVGYDEAGQLTEKIRRKPYSVVLFDEIEKAHPDVLNILLQILDDGRITDAHGREVNFQNTVVIMTSNAGSGNKGSGSMGFDRSVSELTRERALKALSDIMRPEFINRVDEIVAFNQLSKADFGKIADIMLEELRDALKEKGTELVWAREVVDYLAEKSYSVKYGARNLRRLIQKEIEDGLANLIIDNYERGLDRAYVHMHDGAVCITMIEPSALPEQVGVSESDKH
ncbi:ATP-dependent Clp protease ATP-binding subunit [Oscillospiraceae bacterium OttesenSCG-928-F05]|nr:ATP-dependent Clp protease ATP-binding subunit [Oscillospiraceae bacterium OttesenSCG-928-F05]